MNQHSLAGVSVLLHRVCKIVGQEGQKAWLRSPIRWISSIGFRLPLVQQTHPVLHLIPLLLDPQRHYRVRSPQESLSLHLSPAPPDDAQISAMVKLHGRAQCEDLGGQLSLSWCYPLRGP
jgi:hypothetical protein